MQIPTKEIAQSLQELLIAEVEQLKKKGKQPLLKTILVGSASDQLSFVAIKQKKATKLGAKFEFIHLTKEPVLYQEFIQTVKEHANDPKTTGIIIQQPLPAYLKSDSMYNFIPTEKEIEGHTNKSTFLPPIGLAVLTALKYTITHSTAAEKVLVTEKDKEMFQKVLKGKRIVLIGNGITGGQPIAKTLSYLHLNFITLAGGTAPDVSEGFIKEADIIITAVGKKVLTPEMVKPGVILLNVGLRKDETTGALVGDYDEKEMDAVASFYTKTPGGIGPIDVLYLYQNLIDAARKQ